MFLYFERATSSLRNPENFAKHQSGWRSYGKLRSLALAGIGKADLVFWFLLNASMWRRHSKRPLDRHRSPLCRRVSFLSLDFR